MAPAQGASPRRAIEQAAAIAMAPWPPALFPAVSIPGSPTTPLDKRPSPPSPVPTPAAYLPRPPYASSGRFSSPLSDGPVSAAARAAAMDRLRGLAAAGGERARALVGATGVLPFLLDVMRLAEAAAAAAASEAAAGSFADDEQINPATPRPYRGPDGPAAWAAAAGSASAAAAIGPLVAPAAALLAALAAVDESLPRPARGEDLQVASMHRAAILAGGGVPLLVRLLVRAAPPEEEGHAAAASGDAATAAAAAGALAALTDRSAAVGLAVLAEPGALTSLIATIRGGALPGGLAAAGFAARALASLMFEGGEAAPGADPRPWVQAAAVRAGAMEAARTALDAATLAASPAGRSAVPQASMVAAVAAGRLGGLMHALCYAAAGSQDRARCAGAVARLPAALLTAAGLLSRATSAGPHAGARGGLLPVGLDAVHTWLAGADAGHPDEEGPEGGGDEGDPSAFGGYVDGFAATPKAGAAAAVLSAYDGGDGAGWAAGGHATAAVLRAISTAVLGCERNGADLVRAGVLPVLRAVLDASWAAGEDAERAAADAGGPLAGRWAGLGGYYAALRAGEAGSEATQAGHAAYRLVAACFLVAGTVLGSAVAREEAERLDQAALAAALLKRAGGRFDVGDGVGTGGDSWALAERAPPPRPWTPHEQPPAVRVSWRAQAMGGSDGCDAPYGGGAPMYEPPSADDGRQPDSFAAVARPVRTAPGYAAADDENGGDSCAVRRPAAREARSPAPLVSALVPVSAGRACACCGKAERPLGDPSFRPCQRCQRVVFCSIRCNRDAHADHRRECIAGGL